MKKSIKTGKGSLKISNFFSKQVKDKTENSTNIQQITDSDDDFEVTNPKRISASTFKETILGPITNKVSNNVSGLSTSRKRKGTECSSVSSPPRKKNTINIKVDTVTNNKPSVCEYPTTPTKRAIFIKSPEKLLTPSALKEYLTPEKNPFSVKTPVKSPTPRKLFNGDDFIVRSPIKLTSKTPIKENKTPTIAGSSKGVHENTPTKMKRTPKKLFEKSPDKLDDFNVQVIENFVKITPSKSSQKIAEKIVTSSEKKQVSILNFMSPKISDRSLAAKSNNETTPKKNIVEQCETSPMPSKAKVKLNFSNGTTVNGLTACSSKTNSEQNLEKCSGESEAIEKEKSDEYLEFNFDDSWGENIDIDKEVEYSLDLSESQHCKVLNIDELSGKKIITLQSTKNNQLALCNVQGFWLHVNLNTNDTVHVSAKKDANNEWILNNDFGLLVYEPDFLISTTSVVNTLFCKRRSVLSARFFGFEPTNHFMVTGTIIHNLLQTVLKERAKTVKEIEYIANSIINTKDTIKQLFECGMTKYQLEEEISKFVPKIVEFIDTYVQTNLLVPGKQDTRGKNDWKGTIQDIEDIEDNIWCPELGVKGKVDISIKTNNHVMPIELKTGKTTVSLEHRGQVMLYIMMMNKLGYNVPSGLLLYLREGVLREIPMTHNEKRDIIMLRNELTFYLTRKPEIHKSSNSYEKTLVPPELPEPINHKSCLKCPYNVICASHIRYQKEDISNNRALKQIQDDLLSHINDVHLNYFMHWTSLLALESNSQNNTKDVRQIYTVEPKKRESNGKCIINLKIVRVGMEINGLYEHIFKKRSDEDLVNFLACGIAENNYVVVSLDKRPAVSAGFVNYIDSNSITVSLDRDLRKKHSNQNFHIDSYDSNSIQSYNMASLALLLEVNDRASKLRKHIIDKTLPCFETKLPKIIAIKGTPILKRLNKVQQRAVLKGLAAKDYLLIKGMPGTGKTATIVALIQLLYELDKTVLITSHTHSAVDNVCSRLTKYGVKLMRLGAESRIHPSLKKYSEHALTKDCKTPEELEKVYSEQKVLAVTCLGSGHPILSKRTMDICIVDESTQVLQPSVIRPLYTAKTFILIGDPDQLTAVVRNPEAIELGMSESLFERLQSEEAIVPLNINYRMNKPITALANALTYNGELLIGNEEVANATLKMNLKNLAEDFEKHKWLLSALDGTLENAVQFLSTGPVWKLSHTVNWNTTVKFTGQDNESKSCTNIYEAALVFTIVKALLKADVFNYQIGVIATYRAQVILISSLLHSTGVDVSTVDQFQGKDKNVIIYSCTKSKDRAAANDFKFELLEDHRRLNVAITRAKNKLILLGDLSTLSEYSTFKKLVPSIEKNIIDIEEYISDNFNWESILNIDISEEHVA